MNRLCRYILLTQLLGFFMGCDGVKKPEVVTGAGIRIFEAPSEMMLAKVGSDTVTVGDFRRHVGFDVDLYRLMKEESLSAKRLEEAIGKYEQQRCSGALTELVRDRLLEQYLAGSCSGSSVEGGEKAVDDVLSLLAKKTKKRKMTIEDLSKALSVDCAYTAHRLCVGVREKTALKHFDPDYDQVSESEIDAGIARLDAYTEIAVLSNRVTWSTCSNVLAQVRAGANFEEMGERYGVTAEEACEWGFFIREDLQNEQLRTWAFSAKVGEIGGPFDIEDGLSIVKVLKHEAGTSERSVVSMKTEEVTLARINFSMIDEHPEPRDRDFCRKAILRRKYRVAFQKLFGMLYDNIKVEYPSGTKIDFRR